MGLEGVRHLHCGPVLWHPVLAEHTLCLRCSLATQPHGSTTPRLGGSVEASTHTTPVPSVLWDIPWRRNLLGASWGSGTARSPGGGALHQHHLLFLLQHLLLQVLQVLGPCLLHMLRRLFLMLLERVGVTLLHHTAGFLPDLVQLLIKLLHLLLGELLALDLIHHLSAGLGRCLIDRCRSSQRSRLLRNLALALAHEWCFDLLPTHLRTINTCLGSLGAAMGLEGVRHLHCGPVLWHPVLAEHTLCLRCSLATQPHGSTTPRLGGSVEASTHTTPVPSVLWDIPWRRNLLGASWGSGTARSPGGGALHQHHLLFLLQHLLLQVLQELGPCLLHVLGRLTGDLAPQLLLPGLLVPHHTAGFLPDLVQFLIKLLQIRLANLPPHLACGMARACPMELASGANLRPLPSPFVTGAPCRIFQV